MVLLEAGVERNPAVGVEVAGTAAGAVVDIGFDPDVFELEGAGLTAAADGLIGDAGLGEQALGGCRIIDF